MNHKGIDPTSHLGRRINQTKSRIQQCKRHMTDRALEDHECERLKTLYRVLYQLKVVYDVFDGRDPLYDYCIKNPNTTKTYLLKGEEPLDE